MAETPHDEMATPQPLASDVDVNVDALLVQLRRKEGNWVEWGQACQVLQRAGYSEQAIFEETGFEPIHQNQVIVGAQVYGSIVAAGVSEAVQAHFEHKGSDILYELRILTQPDRAAVAELTVQKGLDLDEAHDAAKAVKDYSRVGSLPEGFARHPGDAIAYQVLKLVRHHSDLQERSRLIARGLRFAHTNAARKRVEQLLTEFTTVAPTPAPKLPVYRLEESEYFPRMVPVVGKLPLARADLLAVPLIEEEPPFGLVKFSGTGAWVAIPGWQVVQLAEDPVAILCDSDALPTPLPGSPEAVLMIVDRAQRTWDISSYFLVDRAEQIEIQWFDEAPDSPILGRIILVLRPKKVLDEDYGKDPWQLDE